MKAGQAIVTPLVTVGREGVEVPRVEQVMSQPRLSILQAISHDDPHLHLEAGRVAHHS